MAGLVSSLQLQSQVHDKAEQGGQHRKVEAICGASFAFVSNHKGATHISGQLLPFVLGQLRQNPQSKKRELSHWRYTYYAEKICFFLLYCSYAYTNELPIVADCNIGSEFLS